MGNDRGEYRSIHTVLVDSPEFIDLSPAAQLVFFQLKLRLGPSGIAVIPAVEHVLAEATGYHPDTIGDAMGDAIAKGFLVRERNVLWIRNGLKFEPSRSLTNENHVTSIVRYIASLPKLKIVKDFADYYDLNIEWHTPYHTPSPADGIPNGIPKHGRRKTETEDGKVVASSSSVLSNSPPSKRSAREATARGVFYDKELEELCLEGKSYATINGVRVGVALLRVQLEDAVRKSGEDPSVILDAIRIACELPEGHEDKPTPPFSLRWILHDPGRMSRMVGAYFKQQEK